ncbi:MAG: alkaline phosphatase [Pseudomonadota bacterium]
MSPKTTRHPRPGLLLALLLLLALCAALGGQANAAPAAPAKSVILFIADGCGAEQYTLARWFKGAPLAFDGIMTGGVRTFIADSVVADSAPAATAYASGLRSSNKVIGLGPSPKGLLPGQPDPGAEALRPLATTLEAARLMGKSTGLVATARITHATPAAFAAHVPKRSQEAEIAKQMAHQGLTVLMGGGRRYFLPKSAGGDRGDGLDLLAEMRRQGCDTAETSADLDKIKSGRLVGLFAADHLAAELDRPQLAPDQPTLARMTAKALDLLAKNPKGFFLMVEGSQIDWADHANDPAHLLGDMLAFDAAVDKGLDFARRHPGTMVVVVSDHNTGGMSIGNRASDKCYNAMKSAALLEPLGKMKVTAKTMWKQMGEEVTADKLRQAVAGGWGLDITLEEAERIVALSGPYDKESKHYPLGEVLCPKYTMIGWTTHGHTGGDVPLFAFGPGRPTGLMAAPELGLHLAKALGADLRKLDQRLFAEAGSALAGASYSDEPGPGGWVLKASGPGGQAVFVAGSNLAQVGGRSVALEGVVVRVEDTGR